MLLMILCILQDMFRKQGSLKCNLCVDQAFYSSQIAFVVVAVPSNRWCRNQSDAIHGITWVTWCAMAMTKEPWSHEKVPNMIQYKWVKHVPNKINCQFMMRVQCVR